MLDTLGFHTDRDYQAQLTAINGQVGDLIQQITANNFHRPEDRTHTYRSLDNLQRRARVLEPKAAEQNQRLDWIADSVRMADDPDLGFIAYVVFGTAVLPH